MPLLTAPRSFLNANLDSFAQAPLASTSSTTTNATLLATLAQNGPAHPSLPHLALLVFEAVLEVVCVSLPGYVVARMGMFDATAQKFVANLNVTVFTPSLSKSSSFPSFHAERSHQLCSS